ncbi:MAG: hypothetical protein AAFP86_08010, partial [Planctomycetota bacterium]
DIDLTGVTMTPIGDPTTPFTGSFDGNGFEISNLVMFDFMAPAAGLFGATDSASFTDVRLTDPDVTGFNNVGCLAGTIVDTDATRCTVLNGAVLGVVSVGGMFGRTAGSTLDRCSARADVEGFTRWAGGLVGHVHLDSSLQGCRTAGTVLGNESVGGMSGNLHQSVMWGCSSRSAVEGRLLVGGLTGWMQENLLADPPGTSAILDCSARGDVLATAGGVVSLVDPGGNQIYLIGAAGGLVGWADRGSYICGSIALGDVDGPEGASGSLNGGFVGRAEANCTIAECMAFGDVTGSSAGGFASWTMDDVHISDSVAYGNVTSDWQTGGFVGAFERGHLTNCHAHGHVVADGQPNGHADPGRLLAAAGGLVGYTFPSAAQEFACVITDCSASGSVKSNGQMTGGLIGLAWGVQVIHSKATGDVKCTERRVGGLVGAFMNSTQSGFQPRCELLSCYASGRVIQTMTDPGYDGMVGGLVGEVQTHPAHLHHLHRSYSSGAVSGSGTVGGLVGESGPDYLYHPCYWDTVTSGQSTSAIGTGLTTAEMYQQASFAGWNFPFPWTIDEGNDYPRLHWE